MDSSCDLRMDIWKRLLSDGNVRRLSHEKPQGVVNQHIVEADIHRTRPHDLTEEEKELLELCLLNYCKEENISYRQGLNELIAPFILMNRLCQIPSHVAYGFFKSFMQLCLPTMFRDNELRPLQALFLTFRLLLRYHDPTLCAFLFMNGITPELFATSWFLTLFSCKINNIKSVYYLFEELVVEADPLFPVYIGMSFLQKYKNDLLSTEEVLLPQTICGMSLEDEECLKEIIVNSRELKRNMPYSVQLYFSEINIFDLSTISDLIEDLETEFCLSVDPREILQRAYPEGKVCNCLQGCEWCMHRERVALLLLDVRTAAEQHAGAIPNSLPINEDAYSNREIMLDFPDQFLDMRGVVHLCLIGRNKFKSKTFDLGHSDSSLSADPVEDMIHNLLQAFIVKGFPYISLVDGGFFECHELAKECELRIDEHDEKKCLACKVSRTSDVKSRASSRSGESKETEVTSQSRSLSDPSSLDKIKADPTAAVYSCKTYDKDLDKSSSEEFLLIVTKNFIYLGMDEDRKKGRKSQIVEQMKLENLSKIKSYSKDAKVLTLFFEGTKRLFCYMLNSQSNAKDFIKLTKKNYAALKRSF
ncbi:TBC1D23_6 [Blepharisma stoltei]|uniref:TBC1 domain family member 23 n=1 Tax=Blepharisma stoltei TaxID=1481888 RepID=A0AAU9IPU9_9CILI|nr:unnamed protein product [Blepharisma stoltei]